jgi:hypothetical protein
MKQVRLFPIYLILLFATICFAEKATGQEVKPKEKATTDTVVSKPPVKANVVSDTNKAPQKANPDMALSKTLEKKTGDTVITKTAGKKTGDTVITTNPEVAAVEPGIKKHPKNKGKEKKEKKNEDTLTEEEPNSTTEYKAQAISTNFTVPILRVNFIDKDATGAPTDRKANVSFFNSIGAGVGYYWGRLVNVTDDKSTIISTEMTNTFGIQGGFLFSANSGASSNTNVFALTFGISVLNFQVGYGYELGTVDATTKRGFMTVAYGIPISKLIRGGFFVTSKKDLTAAKKREGFQMK